MRKQKRIYNCGYIWPLKIIKELDIFILNIKKVADIENFLR